MLEKRLGVPASVVLTEALADMVDDEMRRLHLPSRASMIRLAIEEYFKPDDTSRFDHQLEDCRIELSNKTAAVERLKEDYNKRYEAIQSWRAEASKWERQCDRLMDILEVGAQHTTDTDKMLLSPSRTVVEEIKPIKYREYWWQFWLPVRASG